MPPDAGVLLQIHDLQKNLLGVQTLPINLKKRKAKNESNQFRRSAVGRFSKRKGIGWRPLNVTVRLQSLGIDTAIISRRGDDADGEELLRQIQSKNVNTDYLQVCHECATSLVKVHLDKYGSASYEIVYPCAWDRIAVDDAAIKRVAESDAFVFGSLATRDEVSRKSLAVLLKEAKFKIF